MSYMFDVILQGTAKDLFHHAFASHMENRGYSLTHLGGGGQEILGFRLDEDLVSFSVSSEGHGLYKISIHSETVPLENLIIDSILQSASILMNPFLQSLTGKPKTNYKDKIYSSLRKLIGNINNQ